MLRLNRQPKSTGFTLIEMMVAISIFAVVAVIASGALITVQRINQKAKAIKLVMDNLNFALDGMALKMRQGGVYECLSLRFNDPPTRDPTPTECSVNGGVGIFFTSTGEKKNFVYQFNEGTGAIQYWETDIGFGGGPFVDITRADLTVTNLKFYVFNDLSLSPYGPSWPRVFISLLGETTAGGDITQVAIQNTVSGRSGK